MNNKTKRLTTTAMLCAIAYILMVVGIVQSCTFAGIAAIFYKKNHSLKGAVAGLVTGLILATIVMLLWNYFLTPIYMGMPREAVAEMLIPVILPFNLLKGGINVSLTILLYKHIVMALRKANLVPPSEEERPSKSYVTNILVVALIILIVCVFVALKNIGVI